MLELQLAKTLTKTQPGRRLPSLKLKTALFGIFLACTALFVGGLVIGGYHQTFQRAILNFNAHILVRKPHGYLSEFEEKTLINEVKSYAKTHPSDFTFYGFSEGLIATDQGISAVVFKGVEMAKLSQMYPFTVPYARKGDTSQGVFVGSGLKKKGLRSKGGWLSFLVSEDQRLKSHRLPFLGEFRTGIEPYDSEFVLLDKASFALVSGREFGMFGLEIRLRDFQDIEGLHAILVESLGDRYEVLLWNQLNYSLLDGLKLEKTTFSIVGMCILLIACLNIFGFNLLFFLQNRESFQILSLLGYSRKRIQRLLAFVSMGLGLVASVAAFLVATGVYYYLNVGPGFVVEMPGLPAQKIEAVWNSQYFVLFFVGTLLLCLATSALASRVILKEKLSS